MIDNVVRLSEDGFRQASHKSRIDSITLVIKSCNKYKK
jgi:hypothetical protein